MSEISKLPEVDGAKDQDKKDEEKQARDTLADEVIHMDLVTTLGVEANPIEPDIVGTPTQQKTIQQTIHNNDNTNHTNVNATIPKAKRNVRKKKEIAAMTDTEAVSAAAQGTPIPDPWWKEYLEEQRRHNTQILDALKGMRTFRAEAAPLQDASIVPPTEKTVITEDPNTPETMIALATHAKPIEIVLPAPEEHTPVPESTKRKRDFDAEGESYAERFRKALKTFEYGNASMRGRAEQDPSQGHRPFGIQISNDVYF